MATVSRYLTLPSVETNRELLTTQAAMLSRLAGRVVGVSDVLAMRGVDSLLATLSADGIRSRIVALADVLEVKRDAMARQVLMHPRLLRSAPATIRANQRRIAKGLGLAYPRYMRMAMTGNGLIWSNAENTLKRAKGLARVLDLSPAAFAKTCLLLPSLLMRDPASVALEIDEIGPVLGLRSSQVYKLVRSCPAVVLRRTATLSANVNHLAAVLRMSREEALALALRRPHVMLLSPLQLAGKVPALARALGVGETVARHLMRVRPQQLVRAPGELGARIDGLAGVFGVTRAEIIATALGVPHILEYTPEMVARKSQLVCTFLECFGEAASPAYTLRRLPIAYTYSEARLVMRIALANARIGPRNPIHLLRMPDAKVVALKAAA